MSDEPINLTDEFRAAKVKQIKEQGNRYIIIELYLQGHNRDWYEASVLLDKKKIKEIGK